jgi:hypothetical protein
LDQKIRVFDEKSWFGSKVVFLGGQNSGFGVKIWDLGPKLGFEHKIRDFVKKVRNLSDIRIGAHEPYGNSEGEVNWKNAIS